MKSWRTDSLRYVSVATIIAVSVLMALWYYFTPCTLDDLRFINPWREFLVGNEAAMDFAAYREWILDMARGDSFRTFNLLAPLMLIYIPRWMLAAMNGAAFGAVVALSCTVLGVKMRRFPAVCLLIFMLEAFLPWNDFLNTVVFSLNYLWPLIPALCFVIWYKRVGDGRLSACRMVVALLLAFLVGTLTELLLLAIVCGILGWHLASRCWPGKGQWWMIATMLIAGIVIVTIEITGKYQGLIDSVNPFNKSVADLLTPILTQGYLTLVMIAMLIWRRLKYHPQADSTLAFMAAASIGGVILNALLPGYGERIYFFPQFFAIMAIMRILADRELPKIPGWVSMVSGVALVALVAAHLVAAIIFTARVDREITLINERYLTSGASSGFARVTTTRSASLLVWNKCSAGAITTYPSAWMWHPIFHALRHMAPPLPVEFLDSSSATPVDGNAGIYDNAGYWVTGDTISPPHIVTVTYRLIGHQRSIPLNQLYYTDQQGKRWVYLYEDRASLSQRLLGAARIDRY